MRGGLSVARAGGRPRFAYARPVNSLWLEETRRLLTPDEPVVPTPRPWDSERLARAHPNDRVHPSDVVPVPAEAPGG